MIVRLFFFLLRNCFSACNFEKFNRFTLLLKENIFYIPEYEFSKLYRSITFMKTKTFMTMQYKRLRITKYL